MGQLVVAQLREGTALVAAVDRGGLVRGCFADADVVIDFSLPEGTLAAIPHLGACALVTGTTGGGAELEWALDQQSKRSAVLSAANFSTGVNVMLDLVERAARVLDDAYDIEIIEAHHRRKRDAPSGTALALAEAAARGRGVALGDVACRGRDGVTGERPRGEIGLHAIRGGDVAGEHAVWLAGPGERVMLGHVASSKVTFVHGAIRAARWVSGRAPGRYTMAQVLGLAGKGAEL